MKYMMVADRKIMRWTRPNALQRYYELRSNGALYASLKWKKMFGSLAEGESREVKFTLKRAGFLRPFIIVRKEGSGGDYATLRFSSGSLIMNTMFGPSGILKFESGEKYLFSKLSFWKSSWAFTDLDGNAIVTFDKKKAGRPSGTATINSEIRSRITMDLLLILGWYVIVLDHEEEGAYIYAQ
jgi:hypothetical protein